MPGKDYINVIIRMSDIVPKCTIVAKAKLQTQMIQVYKFSDSNITMDIFMNSNFLKFKSLNPF